MPIEGSKAKECKLCGHTYIHPCDGKKNDCANAVWVRSEGKIDLSHLTFEQIQEFKKSGAKVPDVPPTTIKKPKRIRLEEIPEVKKRTRVRL